MKVRELIQRLHQHDPDMEVIVPSDSTVGVDFMVVAGVEADVFWPDPRHKGNYQLAELSDPGSITAVRLCGKP